MIEVRCPNCNKLLGRFDGLGEIKCPRAGCGRKITFDTKEKKVAFAPEHVPLKDRAGSGGHTFR